MKEKQIVTLYDPHPGIGGAIVPLPKSVKEIADKLNGKRMTLEEAINKIFPVAKSVGGIVKVHSKKYKFISFQFNSNNLEHHYLLLRYK